MTTPRLTPAQLDLLAGRPVTVVVAWGPGATVRNVLIRFDDGSITIRPFRGLRRVPTTDKEIT